MPDTKGKAERTVRIMVRVDIPDAPASEAAAIQAAVYDAVAEYKDAHVEVTLLSLPPKG